MNNQTGLHPEPSDSWFAGQFEHSLEPGCALVEDTSAEDVRDAGLAAWLQQHRGAEPVAECAACVSEWALYQTYEGAARASVGAARRSLEERAVSSIVEQLTGSQAEWALAGVPMKSSATPRGRLLRFSLRPGAIPGWQKFAAAAVVLLGVALVLPWLTGPPRLGDPAPSDVLRGSLIEGLAPSAELAAAPLALRCAPADGAARYRFRLTTGDEELILEEEAIEPRLSLLPIAGSLQPFVRYVWTVVALDDAGNQIASSPPTQFEIRPEAR
jgi:hypothetical protein